MSVSLKHYLSNSDLILNVVSEGIYGFDIDGNAVFINPAAEQMTGWQSAQLIGKNIHQYHHHSHSDGSNYPALDCKIYGSLKDGITRHVTDEVFWRHDGSSFPVAYTVTPVLSDNNIIGAVVIFRDISQQLQAESALHSALSDIKQLSEQLQAENSYLHGELKQEWSATGFVGSSALFKQMLEQIELVAQTASTVLILGENGTGKELVARNLHNLSTRKHKPLVRVNCAAFTENLLESELFGHEKGSFTGAFELRKGRFELADQGTLFLDEIAELSLEAQSKLLRVLQESEFERVGGNKTIKVNIRVIAATNRDLLAMVEQNKFRMDLYYRLNVFPIHVPALRDRIEHIPELCHAIIHNLNNKLAKNISAISNKSLTMLSQYHWPGNVRELQNILEREVILANGNILNCQQKLLSRKAKPIANLESLAVIEKNHILAVLKHCQWRIGGMQGAAKILDMPDSTLRSKMKNLAIKRPI